MNKLFFLALSGQVSALLLKGDRVDPEMPLGGPRMARYHFRNFGDEDRNCLRIMWHKGVGRDSLRHMVIEIINNDTKEGAFFEIINKDTFLDHQQGYLSGYLYAMFQEMTSIYWDRPDHFDSYFRKYQEHVAGGVGWLGRGFDYVPRGKKGAVEWLTAVLSLFHAIVHSNDPTTNFEAVTPETMEQWVERVRAARQERSMLRVMDERIVVQIAKKKLNLDQSIDDQNSIPSNILHYLRNDPREDIDLLSLYPRPKPSTQPLNTTEQSCCSACHVM